MLIREIRLSRFPSAETLNGYRTGADQAYESKSGDFRNRSDRLEAKHNTRVQHAVVARVSVVQQPVVREAAEAGAYRGEIGQTSECFGWRTARQVKSVGDDQGDVCERRQTGEVDDELIVAEAGESHFVLGSNRCDAEVI